jgi:integrase
MSGVPEELPIRELLLMLLGEEGRRKLVNKTKTNSQLFQEYYDLIASTHSDRSKYESHRVLEKFRSFIGDFPPSTDLAIQFLSRYEDRRVNTKARYAFILNAFFNHTFGQKLPLKIKQAKILPEYVPGDDIDKLLERLKSKKSHKKTLKRDLALINTAKHTGLRRSELSNLKVGDLNLVGDNPILIVRNGKGHKDRSVPLNKAITKELAEFVQGKPREQSVFDLAAKSISMKIHEWAQKAGVPNIHTHSLRHFVGTELFKRGANPRSIQAALGHESLEVTMRYAAVLGKDVKQAMELLDEKSTPCMDGWIDYDDAWPERAQQQINILQGSNNPSKLHELR